MLRIKIYSPEKPVLTGAPQENCIPAGKNEWLLTVNDTSEAGAFQITARANQRESECVWYRRKSWSFYLKAARREAWEKPQKTGSHCEGWYGFFSAFLAARYFPEPELDAKLLEQFSQLLPLAFDPQKGVPTLLAKRIQNTAIAVSLCEDAWRSTGNIEWLKTGARFADYLIDFCQDEQGAFVSESSHYTCVIYIAKSILELYLAEKEQSGDAWAARANKHFAGAKTAIDELLRNLDNIGTEGEHTFEDGMISCAFTQLALMGLLLNEEDRKPYIEAAEYLLGKHRCLERMGSPDARSRNTTLRFWEAQYDVLIPVNMITSPHGWSAWKIYGTWYLYLLTGNAEYLLDTMETLGSCMQLMDTDETLRWAFVPDPHIDSGLWVPDEQGRGYLKKAVYGETYLDMISGWYRPPRNTPVFCYLGTWEGFHTDEGGCCDQDVHECFKALEEVALPYAYLWEDDQGVHVLNGCAEQTENGYAVIPDEACIRAIHVNMRRLMTVTARFADLSVSALAQKGWLSRIGFTDAAMPPLK